MDFFTKKVNNSHIVFQTITLNYTFIEDVNKAHFSIEK